MKNINNKSPLHLVSFSSLSLYLISKLLLLISI